MQRVALGTHRHSKNSNTCPRTPGAAERKTKPRRKTGTTRQHERQEARKKEPDMPREPYGRSTPEQEGSPHSWAPGAAERKKDKGKKKERKKERLTPLRGTRFHPLPTTPFRSGWVLSTPAAAREQGSAVRSGRAAGASGRGERQGWEGAQHACSTTTGAAAAGVRTAALTSARVPPAPYPPCAHRRLCGRY